jgi:anti-anti-sigma regulatory factor
MSNEKRQEAEVSRLTKEVEALQKALEESRNRENESRQSNMNLATGLSECIQVMSEVRDGNLDALVSDMTLQSADHLIVGLGKALNDTISDIKNRIELIKRQTFAIQELSTPVLQLWTDILALPVIGTVDTRRAAEIMERLLSEVVMRKSKFVILDITGVEIVDTKTADHFVKLIRAAGLLGTQCLLTGIRPAVAQTLVEIGVDLSMITTLRDLQAGLHYCLQEMGKRRSQESVKK